MVNASTKDPEDFVISTGEQHSVKEFVNLAANKLGMNINWEGKGVNEIGKIDGKTIFDPRNFRPTEVETLLGDSGKAKKLGWKPKISFNELVEEMIEEDLKLANRDKLLKESGYN